jgi:type VI secretion system protein ImpA
MASAETIDFNAVLAPIPGEKPAGESVRYSAEYDALKEARRADEDLPVGEWQRESKTADWNFVIKLASTALATKSKDLQIAVWLLEGLVNKHGFAGLRDGFILLRELQEKFWDGLYPEIEDGDLEFRAGPLNWLNEKYSAAIRGVAVTNGEQAYSWIHWDESRAVDNLGRQNPEAMQAAIAEGKITSEKFDESVQATGRAFYEILFEDVCRARDELHQLERVVDEKFGRHAPSLIKIRAAVDDSHGLVAGILKKKRQQDPNYKPTEERSVEAAVVAEVAAPSPASRMPLTGSWAGEPRSREEAFQRLAVLAAYLKRVEPQHPVSYLLERAVRWTKMPLEQWLGEVITNQEVLDHLRETLGIKDQNKA